MLINAHTDFAFQRAVIARQGRCLEPKRGGILDACLPEAI